MIRNLTRHTARLEFSALIDDAKKAFVLIAIMIARYTRCKNCFSCPTEY